MTRDARTGQFVSPDGADPATTVTETLPPPDRLDVATDAIVALTDSRPSWTLTAVPGIEISGTDPREMVEQALIRVRAAVAPEGAEGAEQE